MFCFNPSIAKIDGDIIDSVDTNLKCDLPFKTKAIAQLFSVEQ